MHYSFAMLIDLYQLTMAQGYWKLGRHQQQAVFDLFFREHPFQGGYTVFCGLGSILEVIPAFSFKAADVAYLSTLQAVNKKPLFQTDFLEALLNLRLTVNVEAMQEGTLVFPKEPLLRVRGPLWECQLLESILLNLINFPTLVATKAARICYAAKGDPVLEFGLRRAQGENGALAASRAAFIGGVCATSNVLAGQHFGIPLVGTHAHSWVMAFENEQEAFEAYAKVMSDNCIFLVDTYNTVQGIKNAIQVAHRLKASGSRLLGVRLDSGDLAALSIVARQLLDEAGLEAVEVIGSSDLDEYVIGRLKERGAKISRWGVGTRLVTAYEQPALGGVYKLIAIKNERGQWQYKAKVTDDIEKKRVSGIYNVRRFFSEGLFVRDVIYDANENKGLVKEQGVYQELLMPIFRAGKLVYQSPKLPEIQKYTWEQLQKLPAELKVLKPSVQYPVILEGEG